MHIHEEKKSFLFSFSCSFWALNNVTPGLRTVGYERKPHPLPPLFLHTYVYIRIGWYVCTQKENFFKPTISPKEAKVGLEPERDLCSYYRSTSFPTFMQKTRETSAYNILGTPFRHPRAKFLLPSVTTVYRCWETRCPDQTYPFSCHSETYRTLVTCLIRTS